MQAQLHTLNVNPPDGHNWSDYYQAVEGRPPRETLLKALAKFDADPLLATPRFAVDLGCGDGRDTVELLRRGWRVLGIDGEEEAIARLLSRPDIDRQYLETRIDRFEVLSFPENVDLINASFCLQFYPPADFPVFWQKIVAALRVGGRFCGHLIGDRDSWTAYPQMNCFTRQQVIDLLASLETEWLEEEEHPGKTALGVEKHWHLFHIVARKTA
ncbi:SAM-dependent methyltransferase [[Phormidium ambiguum] IAM M-71]|uniref:SAM-dependent methyltransferase n=1 Tax=[Phormidium ambiguum] IAM M-71 TaxID=454136 RepID=A0A1U7IPB1_9CYAN|nr:class I SAM-dependent methyltransferase [Phormidium ambiguum]OKH39100.1 SAM-dependent methyltransferase [Phormidium ambiguum IAM M-71]